MNYLIKIDNKGIIEITKEKLYKELKIFFLKRKLRRFYDKILGNKKYIYNTEILGASINKKIF